MPAAPYGVLLASFSKHSHQQHFVPLFLAHPRLRIVGVADEPDIDPALRASNRRWADELGVPYREDIDKALGDSTTDIVSIGCEIEQRSSLIIRAAAAGKHLWVDKFPGATLDESEAAAMAVERAGIRAIVPGYAYGELARKTRLALATGDLGELLGLHVDIAFGKGWPQPIDERAPFKAPAGQWKYPDLKRELLTVGAYAVGLIQEFLDPIAHVVGHAGAYFFPVHARRGCDDFGSLALISGEGMVATLSAGRTGVAGHPQGGQARATLVGSRQTAIVDSKRPGLDAYLRQHFTGFDYQPPAEDPMQWHQGPPTISTALADDVAGLATGLEDLVAAIDEGRPPRYGVRQARDLMEIILAGYRAAEIGAAVSLPLEAN